MFSKGAKRKLDNDEEELEGKALEASLDGGGVGVGLEGRSKVSYTLQRQTIFNISLMKLYSQRPLGEPQLERRVLINNMLRRIQDELKQEGLLQPLLLPPSPPPDDSMDDGFREAPPSFGVMSAGVSQPSALVMLPNPSPPSLVPSPCQASHTSPHHLEACLTPASLLEDNCVPSPLTFPHSLSPVNQASLRGSVPDSPTLRDIELDPSTAISRTAAANTTTITTSPSPTQSAPVSPTGSPRDLRTVGPKPEAAAVLLVEVSSPPHPPSCLEDTSPAALSSPSTSFLSELALDDVLFADIDTSMYDFDPCMTAGVVAAAGGSLAKLPPVVNADDLLKSLMLPYSGSAPQVSTNQPFKLDLTELDHIMEVLVGS
ncbi:SERTA domain-containing protein 2b [Nothobranchius furzeri]|uniref:SERTA domain containing 2 n=1 Tax=Nothobranchius furzeri TaxID=105023 RepID=A0A1A8UXI2_NOTFU|nr:SERTA domain containing 2 [Nothobranchius furzeri]